MADLERAGEMFEAEAFDYDAPQGGPLCRALREIDWTGIDRIDGDPEQAEAFWDLVRPRSFYDRAIQGCWGMGI
jgi:hypothetical protein